MSLAIDFQELLKGTMCISRLRPQGKQMKLLAWAALSSAPLDRMTAAICVSGITCLVKMLIHWASGLGHLSQDHWGPFGTEQVKPQKLFQTLKQEAIQPYLNQQLLHENLYYQNPYNSHFHAVLHFVVTIHHNYEKNSSQLGFCYLIKFNFQRIVHQPNEDDSRFCWNMSFKLKSFVVFFEYLRHH